MNRPEDPSAPTGEPALAARVAAARDLLAQARLGEVLALLAEPDPQAPPALALQRELLLLRAGSLAATHTNDIARAQNLVDRARAVGDDLLVCEALCASAGVLNRLHLFQEALAQYGRAEALAAQAADPAWRWQVVSGVVRVLYDAELHEQRRDYCAQWLRDEPRMPLDLRLNLLNQLAISYKWLGDQARAREVFQEGLALAEPVARDSQMVAVLHDNLANSCAWTGHFDEGWAHLRRCEQLCDGIGWTPDRRLWHEQARALLVWKGGDAAAALPIFDQVLAIGRQNVQLRTGLIAGLSRKAEAAQDAGRLDLAVEAYRELSALQEQRRHEQAQVQDASLSALVRAARLEVEKHQVEREREHLEARVAERTAELSAALSRLQAEVEVRRATEAALQRARDELELRVQQRTAELQQAMQLLMQREKLAAVGQLVVGVAHELNTPIGNARLAASALAGENAAFRRQLAAQSLRRAELEQFVAAVDEGSALVDRALDRAGELIQRLKAAARPERLGQLGDVDLAAGVRDLVGLLRPGLHAEIDWALDLPEHLPARLDGEALNQVLGQLVDNAARHGLGGGPGRIRIALQADGDARQARLRIADDGAGIAPEHRGRVFEPFFTTRLGQGGSGLGLHRAYMLARDLLHGELALVDGELPGACFELRLPLDPPH